MICFVFLDFTSRFSQLESTSILDIEFVQGVLYISSLEQESLYSNLRQYVGAI